MKVINSVAVKLGLLAIVGMTLMMGGCASTSGIHNPDTEAKIKAKDGIVFGIKVSQKSVATVCETFAAANDKRCNHQDDFNAYLITVGNPTVVPSPPIQAVVLAPKSAGEIGFMDIVKVRLDGFRPAYFEMLAVRHSEYNEDCRWSVNYPSTSGVACPKYDWDYRKNME